MVQPQKRYNGTAIIGNGKNWRIMLFLPKMWCHSANQNRRRANPDHRPPCNKQTGNMRNRIRKLKWRIRTTASQPMNITINHLGHCFGKPQPALRQA
jgi:hypothetical protein